jgi:hypothetical protein
MATTPTSGPHTKAWAPFERNLDSIAHILALGRRELALIKGATTRLVASVGKSSDLTVKPAVVKLQRYVNRYNKSVLTRIDRFQTATLWQVAMLVTCVEAYLQDLLSMAASIDSELMSKSQQLAPYTDVISATSLEELASGLRARWARGWLSDGGPTRWISRLERMGATGYPNDLAPRLELIWGIRHVVVHAAGVATADFVKRHPGIVAAAGDRVRVGNHDFGVFYEATLRFLEPTDRFFLARYPSLLPATVTEPVKLKRSTRGSKRGGGPSERR